MLKIKNVQVGKLKKPFAIFTIFFMLISIMQFPMANNTAKADTTTPYLLSQNRTTYASSNNGGNTSDKVVDGDNTSRWESEWKKDDEWLYVDLGASASITEVKINWENAYAKDYTIEVSDDEVTWSDPIYTETDGKGGNEDIPVSGKGRYVRLHFSKRSQEAYGYSIYEFQVYGTGGINTPPSAPLGENIALNKTATASSVDQEWYITPGQADAKNAFDGDMNTHWGSTLEDNQWIYVDLGSQHTIGRVILDWDSPARSYDLEVSDDAQNWTKVYRQLNCRGGEESIPLYAAGRYVRMNGMTRINTGEFGIKEFKVYDYVEGDQKPVYTIPEIPSSTVTKAGEGSYVSDMSLFPQPREPFEKTDNLQSPIPSNDWWQSLLIKNMGDTLITLPLKAKYQQQGLGLLTPSAGWLQDRSVETEKNIDLFLMANNINTSEMDSKIDGYGDYSANVVLSDDDTQKMKTTFIKGSPYVFTEFSDPNSPEIYSTAVTRIFDDNGNDILANNGDSISADHIGIETVNSNGAPDPSNVTRYYGVFAPKGTTFIKAGSKIKMQLGNGEGYLSVATMPSDSDLNYFYKHAYAFVTDTKADYTYDDKTSDVTTTFKQSISLKRNDLADTTLMCMLPAQWKVSSDSTNDMTYPSVRGTLKVHEGNSFSTVDKFNGMVPQFTEPLNPEYSRSNLLQYLDILDKSTDANYMSGDAYWQGKVLHPLAMGVLIADQVGAEDYKKKFLDRLKTILTDWYTYKPGETEGYYFDYNPEWGTLIYKNSEFGANTGITDHHFTYGYFTFASAVLATYDSDFLKNYGPMVDNLIRDYANPSRTDDKFPQFRNFDPYEGHSWAGGYADNFDGNNQEAAGESLFGWVGEYMWGSVSGNNKYRDAGIYVFTTELRSIEQYWFNYDGDNWISDYNHKTVGQVYGSANFFGTFFNGDSVYVYGIHWLPTGEYLTNYGVDKEKAAGLYEGMKEDIINDYNKSTDPKKGAPPDPNDVEPDWRHITWPIESLSDPQAVLGKWDQDTSKLQQNEMYDTYWFVNNMATLGQRTRDIWAENGVTASVYKNGDKYTALAWNPTDNPVTVQFCSNDGELGYTVVAPKALVAVDPTVKGAISKNSLQAEINVANKLVQTDYTEESWAVFSTALTEAVTVNNNTAATSDQVDTALKNLRAAEVALVKTTAIPGADVNLALNKTAVSSSNEADGLGPQNTTDINLDSRWSSNWAANKDNHPEYVYVDLGQPYFIGDVKVNWSDAYAKGYKVQACVSNPEDESSWQTVSTVEDGTGGLQDSTFTSAAARYVRIYCTNPATQFGYSIKNIEVYGAKVDKTGLKAEIDKASQLNESDYTQESFENFSNVLKEAESVNSNDSATQDKVEEALKNLQAAESQLVRVNVTTGSAVNLALDKSAVSSSNEADGLGAQNTTDENTDSRWSSNWAANTDNHPEYVYVDLGKDYDINDVKVLWDNAYAKGYKVQTCKSNPEDEDSWETAAIVKDENGGLQDSTFDSKSARYVRIYCTDPSTQWGYSIKNIEVYDAEADKTNLEAEIDDAAKLNASDYTQESFENFSDALLAAKNVSSDDKATKTKVDRALKNLQDAEDSLVKIDESGDSDQPADSGEPSDSDVNLALDKSTKSSSNEAEGLGSKNTTDENTDSRWSSDWAENTDNHPEYVYVDLGKSYDISDVKVLWDNAYAKGYKVQTCTSDPEDDNSWETAATVNDSEGGLQDSYFNSTKARYVRIYCTDPLNQFGYSIKNIEIYS